MIIIRKTFGITKKDSIPQTQVIRQTATMPGDRQRSFNNKNKINKQLPNIQ